MVAPDYGRQVKPVHNGNHALWTLWGEVEGPVYLARNKQTGEVELRFKGFYADLELWICRDEIDESLGLATDSDIADVGQRCDFYLGEADWLDWLNFTLGEAGFFLRVKLGFCFW